MGLLSNLFKKNQEPEKAADRQPFDQAQIADTENPDELKPISEKRHLNGMRFLIAEYIIKSIMLFIGISLGVVGALVVTGKAEPKVFIDMISGFIGSLITILATIIGFYFGGKKED